MTSQSAMSRKADRDLIPIALVIAVQFIAVVYFLYDAVREEAGGEAGVEVGGGEGQGGLGRAGG